MCMCMHACMYVCMYVGMYLCVYVSVCACIWGFLYVSKSSCKDLVVFFQIYKEAAPFGKVPIEAVE